MHLFMWREEWAVGMVYWAVILWTAFEFACKNLLGWFFLDNNAPSSSLSKTKKWASKLTRWNWAQCSEGPRIALGLRCMETVKRAVVRPIQHEKCSRPPPQQLYCQCTNTCRMQHHRQATFRGKMPWQWSMEERSRRGRHGRASCLSAMDGVAEGALTDPGQ